MNLILFILIGAIAGWLAGKIMKGRGYGVLLNILVGIIGAFVGGFLFETFGIMTTGLAGELITATAGAVVLIWLIRVIKS